MLHLNSYTTEFFCNCPNNGIRIKYRLRIEKTQEMLSVEELIAAVESLDDQFHEELADELLRRFGGKQTLIAEHHGVTIETTRSHQGVTE